MNELKWGNQFSLKYSVILVMVWVAVYCFSVPVFSDSYAQSEAWHRLLFYVPSGSGSGSDFESLAIDDDFFVSDMGRTDPQSEFVASVEKVRTQDETFRRRFPLRYKRLCEYLQAPYRPLVSVNPEINSVTLGFPSHYMANPSSIFGHLFLLLNSDKGLVQSDILHFIASTEGTNPNLYVYNGLAGVFKGKYLAEPYFIKIKDYNDEDDREVIYYDMNLSPSQIEDIQFLFMELSCTRFDYYFLDGNCAVFIARFLEIILDYPLMSDSWIILPADVILNAHLNGLLLNEYHRRASTHLFYQTYFHLNRSQRARVIELATTAFPSTFLTDSSSSDSVISDDLETSQDLDALKKLEDLENLEDPDVYRAFLLISEYLINNNNTLSPIVRSNRIFSYRALQQQGLSQVRPGMVSSSRVVVPKPREFRLGYGLNDRLFLSYTPVRFSVENPLETKRVGVLRSRFIYGSTRPSQVDLTFVDLESITPFNKMVGAKSWTLNSMVGYETFTYTHHSLLVGMGRLHSDFGKLFGQIGAGISNYNPITETPLSAVSVMPMARIGLDGYVYDRVFGTLSYLFLHDGSYGVGSVGYSLPFGSVLLEGVYFDMDFLARFSLKWAL